MRRQPATTIITTITAIITTTTIPATAMIMTRIIPVITGSEVRAWGSLRVANL